MSELLISKLQLSRWEARALTIKLKAQALQADMLNRLGFDDYATDMGDNLVSAADDLLDHFDMRRKRLTRTQATLLSKEGDDRG